MIRGFVVRERGKSTKLEYDNLVKCDHYHIVFTNNDNESLVPDHNRFLKHIDKQIKYLNLGRTKHGLIPKQFHEEINPKHKRPIRKWLLQDYYNDNSENRLEHYLLKTANDWTKSNDFVFDCIGIINREKVEFGPGNITDSPNAYT